MQTKLLFEIRAVFSVIHGLFFEKNQKIFEIREILIEKNQKLFVVRELFFEKNQKIFVVQAILFENYSMFFVMHAILFEKSSIYFVKHSFLFEKKSENFEDSSSNFENHFLICGQNRLHAGQNPFDSASDLIIFEQNQTTSLKNLSGMEAYEPSPPHGGRRHVALLDSCIKYGCQAH